VTPLAARFVGSYAQFVSGLATVLGTVGLIRTHFDGFAAHQGVSFATFTVNPLTNIILLAAGLIGIAMARRLEAARGYARWVGIGGVVWGLLEFVLRDSSADIFGRDRGLATLTLVVGLGGLGVWWAARGALPTSPSGVSDPA
jgi:Domain of unknown function (DUF4383)